MKSFTVALGNKYIKEQKSESRINWDSSYGNIVLRRVAMF